ncbi:enoyl-CoA hydratase-related protein [Thermodesulfobacteriota bacterium]
MEYQDIIYEKKDHVARVTINRPEVLNAFRARTCAEMVEAFRDAADDPWIGVLVLTGTGERAFCVGGDLNWEAEGVSGAEGVMGLGPHINFYTALAHVPKPTIAAVRGYAIGGGHVLHLVCDITIASENARFGQNGPRVGSFNPGWGIGLLKEIVGVKKAKEIWMLCRQYSPQEALEMGLVNKVVPDDKLEVEVDKWCEEILALGPTSLQGVKLQFMRETAIHEANFDQGLYGVTLLEQYSPEATEGRAAFFEKRKPDFWKLRENVKSQS